MDPALNIRIPSPNLGVEYRQEYDPLSLHSSSYQSQCARLTRKQIRQDNRYTSALYSRTTADAEPTRVEYSQRAPKRSRRRESSSNLGGLRGLLSSHGSAFNNSSVNSVRIEQDGAAAWSREVEEDLQRLIPPEDVLKQPMRSEIGTGTSLSPNTNERDPIGLGVSVIPLSNTRGERISKLLSKSPASKVLGSLPFQPQPCHPPRGATCFNPLYSSNRISPVTQSNSDTLSEPLELRNYRTTRPNSAPALPLRHDSIPDGGFLAWSHAFLGFWVVFNCWGLNFSYGVFEAFYSQSMLSHLSESQIAWIGSTQLALIFLSAPPVGLLFDRGYVRVFFNGGSALLVMVLFLASACTRWWQLFLVQGLLTGFAMGMTFTSGVLVLMGYFNRNVGLAMGIGAAGSSIGGIVYTLVAQHLLPKIGFGWTMRTIAMINLVTMIYPNLIFRPRPLQTRQNTRHAMQEYLVRSIMHGQSTGADDDNSPPTTHFSLDSAFLLMTGGLFFSFLGLYFPTYYLPLYATRILSLPSSTSPNLLLVLLTTNLPARFISALLSDRCIGPISTLLLFTPMASILTFLILGISTPASLYLLSCFYGFASAGVQSLYAATIAEFNKGHENEAGVRSSIAFAAIGVACLVGPPVMGRLVVLDGPRELPWIWGVVFAGSALAAGAFCFLACRVRRVGWRAERV